MCKYKICFASSSGGHFEQLMMLKPLMEKYESFIVTEKTNFNVNSDYPIYVLKQVNRKERNFLSRLFLNILDSVKIFFKEKPDVIITTGVLAVVPLCLICKIFNRKVIYIESFAKVTSPTITGKILYHIADRFYVQWESMLSIYPKAVYVGSIY